MNPMLQRPKYWEEAGAQNQTRYTMVGEMLMFLLLYFLAAIAQGLIMAIPVSGWLLGAGSDLIAQAMERGGSMEEVVALVMEQMPDWTVLISLFAYGTLGAAAILYCRRFQKRSLASMGLRGPKPLGEYGLGLGFGLVLFGAVLGIGLAAGAFHFGGELLHREHLLLVLLALAGCLIQGAAEELALRGYFAPTLGGRYPVWVVLFLDVGVSVMLRGGSLTSLATVNTLLLGLILLIWTMKRGSLWGACALHGIWNFCVNFLGSFLPAGKAEGFYLLEVEADAYRDALTGGIYGPQASLCATLALLAALAAVLALRTRDPAPPVKPPAPPAANL